MEHSYGSAKQRSGGRRRAKMPSSERNATAGNAQASSRKPGSSELSQSTAEQQLVAASPARLRKLPKRACQKEGAAEKGETSGRTPVAEAAKEKLSTLYLFGRDEVTWERILKHNGAGDFIESTREFFRKLNFEDDPPVIFGWKDGLLEVIRTYHQNHPNVQLPGFLKHLNLHQATSTDVHCALLRKLCTGMQEGVPVIRAGCIVECTIAQAQTLNENCGLLCLNPYLQAIAQANPAAFPLADVYTPKPSSVTGGCTRVARATPPSPPALHLWGSIE